MRKIPSIVLVLAALMVLTSHTPPISQRHYMIPDQSLDLYRIIGKKNDISPVTIAGFRISHQVTLKEYKEYLSSVKRDSSQSVYLSQVPGDRILDHELWQKYLNDPVYEYYPVLGVSWEQAVNYCHWRTLRDNHGNERVFYRLPHVSEWLAAYSYLSSNSMEHDFNQNYSDWLINIKDESGCIFVDTLPSQWPLDQVYAHKPGDPRALIRKMVIGNSYLFQMESLWQSMWYGYADEGYRYIGFRYVTENQ